MSSDVKRLKMHYIVGLFQARRHTMFSSAALQSQKEEKHSLDWSDLSNL